MTHKFKRPLPSSPRRNIDYVTDYDPSPSPSQSQSQSPYEDENDASSYTPSESINSIPSQKSIEYKNQTLNISPSSAPNSPNYLHFPYINVAPLPIFHGNRDESPSMHLSRFIKVCRANNASSIDSMMKIFPVTLENEASLWYDLNIEPYPKLSWEEIKASFFDAYKNIELADQLRSELMTIKQGSEEMVRSYFLRLQLILKKWPDNELPDGLLRAIFVDGLREDFKEWIIPQKPSSLNEALRMAFGFEQVRSVRTIGKRILKCGFCEGGHNEEVCEVRERMRELWKRGKEKKKVVDDDENEGGDMMVLKKKSQCQCWKHQCGKKQLDRNLSNVSRDSKVD